MLLRCIKRTSNPGQLTRAWRSAEGAKEPELRASKVIFRRVSWVASKVYCGAACASPVFAAQRKKAIFINGLT